MKHFHLQGIFFNKNRPSYMNYGSIGWVIGHEITHGFDDQGRQYNFEGNLDNWWELETFFKFLNKTHCIIQQYGNYSVPELGDMPLNGITTQGENIADNGGIKEAYRAYGNYKLLFKPSCLSVNVYLQSSVRISHFRVSSCYQLQMQ